MPRVVAGNMGDVPGLAARWLAAMPCAAGQVARACCLRGSGEWNMPLRCSRGGWQPQETPPPPGVPKMASPGPPLGCGWFQRQGSIGPWCRPACHHRDGNSGKKGHEPGHKGLTRRCPPQGSQPRGPNLRGRRLLQLRRRGRTVGLTMPQPTWRPQLGWRPRGPPRRGRLRRCPRRGAPLHTADMRPLGGQTRGGPPTSPPPAQTDNMSSHLRQLIGQPGGPHGSRRWSCRGPGT